MKALERVRFAFIVIAALVVGFVPSSASEQVAMVKDIAAGPGTMPGDPRNLRALDGSVVFFADDFAHGFELWATDGTAAGTSLLRDIRLGPYGSMTSNSESCVMGGELFFVADDQEWGDELWKTDGTPSGTVRVSDAYPGYSYSDVNYLTTVGDRVFFCASSPGLGQELWVTDGTQAGTSLVMDINPGDGSSCGGGAVDLGGVLLFTASDGVHGSELWRSDGTLAGTFMVKDIKPGNPGSDPSGTYVHDGVAYFSADDPTAGDELFRSDGTEAGTVLVKDINPGSASSYVQALASSGGTLFFVASDGVTPYELFKTDGTGPGTVLVKDINPGSSGSSPSQLTDLGGTLLFAASSGSGRELWKSDGTGAGTVQVKDLWPGAGSSNPASLTPVDSELYFSAQTSATGNELWKSDGTEAGTVLVADISPGADHSYPRDLAAVGGALAFSAEDADDVRRLWVSDGTGPGTAMLEYGELAASGDPSDLAPLGDRVVFSAWEAATGHELWVSDGTEVGTSLVEDIAPGPSGSTPFFMTSLGGSVVFVADDGVAGQELWITDGTSAGTSMIKDINPGSSHALPQDLVVLGDRVVFAARDPSVNPWVTDGTEAGTVKLTASCSNAIDFYSDGSTVYFSCYASAVGAELWKTDGTPAGTTMVKDIVAGPSSSNPKHFGAVGGVVYFSVVYDSELWRTDGTPAGTQLVSTIAAGTNFPYGFTELGGAAFFRALGDGGSELWTSDGTAAGTVQVIDLASGGGNSYPSYLTPFNGQLLFLANDAVSGGELWITDGTAAGTVQVVDLAPGAVGTPLADRFEPYPVFNGSAWLAAHDGLTGSELWKTDGTSSGTLQALDVNPGADSSSPDEWTRAGRRLFFAADDGIHGRELWSAVVAADLAITKDDGLSAVEPGQTATYTITATNSGPSDDPAAHIVDLFPAGLDCSWTCAASGGASCAAGPVVGDIDDTVGLPVGGAVTYTAGCTVLATSGVISNTATVATSPDVEDPEPSDNTATDDTTVVERDFGDAPDPSYETLMASDGARHGLGSGLFLGFTVDAELDGQPTASADGDDLDGTDDEDGVVFTSGLGRGLEASLEVTASGAGLVNAWVDLNADGDWHDAGEQVFIDRPVVAGVNVLGFPVPAGATLGTTFARFRLDSAGGLAVSGYAADGEVEDLVVDIVEGPDLLVDMTASVEPAPSGRPLTYTVTVTNNGPLPASSVTLSDTLPAELSFVGSTPGPPDCSFASGTLTCDLGSMAALESIQVTVETVLGHPVWGSFSNTASVTAAELDPITANNAATVDTRIAVFVDGWETGDLGAWSLSSGD
ncbi:MAG TPA: ELWxxDGT repeat protein [Methylomirabilota bacterium]|nr:ELWxxDGT repeat protein [Methylomirabilota bacterium]